MSGLTVVGRGGVALGELTAVASETGSSRVVRTSLACPIIVLISAITFLSVGFLSSRRDSLVEVDV
jgi:hypothetical protein